MKSSTIFSFLLIIVAVVVGVFYTIKDDKAADPLDFGEREIMYTPPSAQELISVTSPERGQVISSPFVVRGQARGGWYFEATFPISLVDWDGKIIADGYATAEGEWMTEDFVPFSATLTFTDPSWDQEFSQHGWVILNKSNASGLPEHDAAVEIPIKFK